MSRILTVRTFIQEVQSKKQYEKIGCLDFGMKRIGLATTDELKQHAFPMGAIDVKQPAQTEESLSDLNRHLQEFTSKQNVRYYKFSKYSSSYTAPLRFWIDNLKVWYWSNDTSSNESTANHESWVQCFL